jgi:chromosome segregation ATPase
LNVFKGILLDYIECLPEITPCIDLTAKSKLFSIIVENLEDAKTLLELNKEIRGGVINIFPLT